MLKRLTQRLYVRLWLAVVLAVAVLTLLLGWAWRLASESQPREAVVRDPTGQILGNGALQLQNHPKSDAPLPIEITSDNETRYGFLTNQTRSNENGLEFVVVMRDGQVLHFHLPKSSNNPFGRTPFGFWSILALVSIAVALATYPIMRKLTRRLESLQRGVEQWGSGNLSARMLVQGHDEVAYLANRFNLAAERIETLVQSHKSLLANASHELRSPLARIRMGVELIQIDGAVLPTTRSQATNLQWKNEIAKNIGELDQLIDEILLASRLDAREADLGTIELVDLLGLTAEECAKTKAELQAPPNGESELLVHGVTKLLRRVVRNLLENARRYGDGEITVQLDCSPKDVSIIVSDRGPGIPEILRERIFTPFYRLPGASERNGGVGLGLALVQSITLRHNGRVYCEDNPGGGARFVVQLPRAANIEQSLIH